MKSVRRLLVSLVACLVGVGWAGASAETLPEPGSISWAEAVATAESQWRSIRTPTDLRAKGRALIRLYQGCTACREDAYERLKSRLESDSQSRELLALVDREEFSDAPLHLSRALIRSGSPLEARTIALREMDKATFVEERLDWIEVLAEIHFQIGEVEQGKRLIQRLREETPASPDYCAKEMMWRSWVGGPSETIEPIADAAALDRVLEEIHSHNQINPIDPRTCCRINLLIEAAYVFAKRFESPKEPAISRLVSLIPEGLQAAQVALARRTPDAKVRASILLSRARRALPFERSRALELIYEASVAGPDGSLDPDGNANHGTFRPGLGSARRVFTRGRVGHPSIVSGLHGLLRSLPVRLVLALDAPGLPRPSGRMGTFMQGSDRPMPRSHVPVAAHRAVARLGFAHRTTGLRAPSRHELAVRGQTHATAQPKRRRPTRRPDSGSASRTGSDPSSAVSRSRRHVSDRAQSQGGRERRLRDSPVSGSAGRSAPGLLRERLSLYL